MRRSITSMRSPRTSTWFFLGAQLADPARLLEGTGKYMRHVKIRPGTEIDQEALAALIQAAYSRVRFLNNIKGDASHG